MIKETLINVFHITDNRECPDCGEEMTRIHRKFRHHLLSLAVPVIRCRCRYCEKNLLVADFDEAQLAEEEQNNGTRTTQKTQVHAV